MPRRSKEPRPAHEQPKQLRTDYRPLRMQNESIDWLRRAQSGSCIEHGAPFAVREENNDCEFAEGGLWKLGSHLHVNETRGWLSATGACLSRCAVCPGCRYITLSVEKRTCVWSRACQLQPRASFRSGLFRNDPAAFDAKLCKRDFVMQPKRRWFSEPLGPGESDEVLDKAHASIKYHVPLSDEIRTLLGTSVNGKDGTWRGPHGPSSVNGKGGGSGGRRSVKSARDGGGAAVVLRENDGLCARLGEQRAFETRCEAVIANMNATLRRQRHRRGLVFSTQRGMSSLWGLGHALSIVYVMHHVCRRVDRYCYLSIYDMDMHRLFGYANGELWSPTKEELAAYGSDVTRLRLYWTPSEDMVARLSKESASLVHVTLSGQLPVQGSSWLPHSLPIRYEGSDGSHEPARFDRCFCRYVTAPLFPPTQAQQRAATGAAVAYHLRTGFADLPNGFMADINAVEQAPSHAHAGKWFNLACDSAVFAERPSFVFSDSPGLVAYLHREYGGLVRHNARVARMTQPSRSWDSTFQNKVPSVTDAVLAGMVPEIEYSFLSSFARPAMARSMCTWRATELERRACSNYTSVYVRDLYMHIGHKDYMRNLCMRRQLMAYHPCKNVSSAECQRRFVLATAAVPSQAKPPGKCLNE